MSVVARVMAPFDPGRSKISQAFPDFVALHPGYDIRHAF